MNFENAKIRLNEVVKTDAIADSNHDFLATHVPLRKITLGHGLFGESKTKIVPERDVFQDIFGAEGLQRHQLVVVEGAAGSGKSHFIRWISSQLEASDEIRQSNVILLIKRKDNTLKGTIRQLLSIDEVKQIQDKDAYERLVKADQAISEGKFKDKILYDFLVEAKNDDGGQHLENAERKGLIALLQAELFQERLQSPGGPIDKIYAKITGTGNTGFSGAYFSKEDFVLDVSFVEQLQEMGLDNRGSRLANKLIPESGEEDDLPDRIAAYLNAFVNAVVQALTGIEPGDFQKIFASIRQELKRNGKDLILLIEDITAFTGVDQSLLNALVVEHTGLTESDNLCRLISVIGTTSQYYGEFRDNYKDRITAHVTIGDDALGSNLDDLYLFFAKYLNAMSLSEAEVKDWYKENAIEDNLPIHSPKEAVSSDSILINGKQCSLYPFTKTAIKNLYNYYLQSPKTPRAILKQIIKPAVDEILWHADHFMAFCGGSKGEIGFAVESRITSIIENIDGLNENEKDSLKSRTVSFVAYYGSGNLDATKQSISKIKRALFENLGFQVFASHLFGTGDDVEKDDDDKLTPSKPIDDKPSMDTTKRKKFEEFTKEIEDWRKGQGSLLIRRSILEPINSFVWNTLNWEQNGVPLWLMNAAKDTLVTGKRLISFDGIGGGKIDGLLTLQRTDETYRLLIAFGQWFILGDSSWNFENGFEQMFFATSWLERHKKEIVKAVLDGAGIEIEEIAKCMISIEIFYRILSGSIEYKQSALTEAVVFEPLSISDRDKLSAHCQTWIDLYDWLSLTLKDSEFHQSLLYFFSLAVPGQTMSAVKAHVVKMQNFSTCFRKCKKDGFKLNVSQVHSPYKAINDLVSLYLRTYSSIEKAIKEERILSEKTINSLYDYFDFDRSMGITIEAEDVQELLNSIKGFYSAVHGVSLAISYKSDDADALLPSKDSIAKAIRSLENVPEDEFNAFFAFSSNPLAAVEPLLNLCKEVLSDLAMAQDYVDKTRERLERQGNWETDEDPRFASVGEQFYLRLEEVEEFKNV